MASLIVSWFIVLAFAPFSLGSEPEAELYIPYDRSGTGNVTFVVQAEGEPVIVLDARTARSLESSDLRAVGALRLDPEQVHRIELGE